MGKNDLWIAAVAHVTQAGLMTTDNDFDHLHPLHLTLIRIDPNTGKTL
jgi:predicted nucleic acid-binding protein